MIKASGNELRTFSWKILKFIAYHIRMSLFRNNFWDGNWTKEYFYFSIRIQSVLYGIVAILYDSIWNKQIF